MSSDDNKITRLPPPGPEQVYVKISALNGGFLTLPEKLFIVDADPDKTTYCPSLCFLIEHHSADHKRTRVVFDLGISRDLDTYTSQVKAHIATRQPFSALPDTKASLEQGGLNPAGEIDYVILSHVHYDHIGTPSDYPGAKFILGSGTWHVLEHGKGHYTKEIIGSNPLPEHRTWELPPSPSCASKHEAVSAARQTDHQWKSVSSLTEVVDFFHDGSFYLVDSPGHLQGHTNVLARLGPEKWVYLGGDCCHDVRIVTGEKEMAEYDDGHGGRRSAHADLPTARKTVRKIRDLIEADPARVEWIMAHDAKWAEGNQHRFFPSWM